MTIQIYKQFASDILQLLGPHKAIRITSGSFMPLSIEDIGPDQEGRRQIALCHYGEQNGDLMRDPEMIFVFHDWKDFLAAEPVSYRNDYMGLNQECYIYGTDGQRTHVRTDLKADFKAFAQVWFRNLRAQGFFGPDTRRTPIA